MKQFQWLDDGLHKMFLDYLHRIYTERLSFYGIQNSDLNRFPKDPTAKDYVNRFRQKPIGIDSRQARAINLFFMARNSVDHYNSGKTQRIFCDLLLDGISDVYNDYFGASMNAPLAPTQK